MCRVRSSLNSKQSTLWFWVLLDETFKGHACAIVCELFLSCVSPPSQAISIYFLASESGMFLFKEVNSTIIFSHVDALVLGFIWFRGSGLKALILI